MITGVVLARNEELNIVACLEALRPHVAELFLIDMESSDRTAELSRPYVDRILSHPLVGNFDAARNMAIPLATYDWLWFVDADEQVPFETGRRVNELVQTRGDEFEGLSIPFKTYFCGYWIRHNGWWPGYTCCRVLKRGHFEFSRCLHGGVQLCGREIRFPASADTAIVHNSFRSLEHYVSKFNRYTTVEGKQLHERGTRYDWRSAIRAMMQDLWMSYELHDARRDGTWGWVVSWQAAQYRWMSYTKLLDEVRARNEVVPESAPQSLAEFFEAMEDELASYRRLKPRLPLGLVVHAEPDELSGGLLSAASRLLALARLGRPLQWRHHTPVGSAGLDWPVDPVLLTLDQTRRPGYGVSIFIGNAVPRPDSGSVYSVYWPIQPQIPTALTSDDRAALRSFDAVWVSSAGQLRTMRQLGVANERLDLVPPWIDSREFSPLALLADRGSADTGFKVLAVVPDSVAAVCQRLFEAVSQASTGEESIVLKLAHRAEPAGVTLLEETVNQWRERPDDGNKQGIHIEILELPEKADAAANCLSNVDAVIVASASDQSHWASVAAACGRPVLIIGQEPTEGLLEYAAWVELPADSVSEAASSTAANISSTSVRDCGRVLPELESLRAAIESLYIQSRSGPLLELAAAAHRRSGEAAADGHLQRAIARLEDPLKSQQLPSIRSDQLRVALEGEFFARHSFSNINEILAAGLAAQPSLALRLERRLVQPAFDDHHPRTHELKPYLKRQFQEGTDITIRHAFPPNWERPERGLWVHIQPWEYGHLPAEWLPALRDHVTEVWAPSQYVRHVYVASGIADEKIKVIPWGCEPDVFTPDAPPLLLPTTKAFRFLFVGGTIPRKGFDRLFEAYLAEFRREDDVCLVIEDMGANSFYPFGGGERIQEALKDRRSPEIVYLSEDLLPSQLASLYTACHCLVAPYRGEGFGLPVLEAMACGLPPVVPKGGPTDDFVTDATGYRLDACEVPVPDMPGLCKTGLEFDISLDDLRSALRHAYSEPDEVRKRGQLASHEIRSTWTWAETVQRMTQRLWELADKHFRKNPPVTGELVSNSTDDLEHRLEVPVSAVGQTDSTCLQKVESREIGPTAMAEPLSALCETTAGVGPLSQTHERPRSVLIQMATGPHKQLLEATRKHHESYARRHGMDFWNLEQNPAEPKRAGWGKITLLLQALRDGYDRAIWLDADAVIMRPEVNLAHVCNRGIGLVQHPNPVHWNTGLLVAAKSPLVERLLAEVDAQPDNDSPWMEQLVLNERGKQPEFQAIFHPLSPAFNATPGAVVAPQPIIMAAHGLPFEHRVTLVTTWLHEVNGCSTKNAALTASGFRVRCREEFADHLNELGLTGSAAEVGVCRGEFSRVFLDRWQGTRLHLVDPWRNLEHYLDISNLSDEEHEQALAEVHRTLLAHAGRYEICRRLSAEAAPYFADGSLDFIYIDANHDYAEVINDLLMWYRKLRPGGILAGHDFVDGLFPEGEFGVNVAVREFEQQTGLKARYTEEGRWTSWYFYRI